VNGPSDLLSVQDATRLARSFARETVQSASRSCHVSPLWRFQRGSRADSLIDSHGSHHLQRENVGHRSETPGVDSGFSSRSLARSELTISLIGNVRATISIESFYRCSSQLSLIPRAVSDVRACTIDERKRNAESKNLPDLSPRWTALSHTFSHRVQLQLI